MWSDRLHVVVDKIQPGGSSFSELYPVFEEARLLFPGISVGLDSVPLTSGQNRTAFVLLTNEPPIMEPSKAAYYGANVLRDKKLRCTFASIVPLLPQDDLPSEEDLRKTLKYITRDDEEHSWLAYEDCAVRYAENRASLGAPSLDTARRWLFKAWKGSKLVASWFPKEQNPSAFRTKRFAGLLAYAAARLERARRPEWAKELELFLSVVRVSSQRRRY